MSTADNKRGVIVGIFVFLGIVILVAAIFTLAGQQKRFISTISLNAVFDDVGGLRTGNNVWFSGVKIGTVRSIQLFGESQVLVTISVEENTQQYIRKNAIARISSESFIGNKNVVLEGGTQEAPPVEDGDRIAAVNPLNTDDLMETLQRNNENLVEITGDLKQLTSRIVQGEGTIGKLLTDSTMAEDFEAMVNNLQQTSRNAAGASRELTQFTSKLNTPGGLADEVLTDTAVYAQIRRSMAQLEEATTSAAALAENLRETSNRLNNESNAVGVLLSDEDFARNLKSTMQNLETSTEKFDENMEALQSNILFRGFFRRRARDEARQQEELQEQQQLEQQQIQQPQEQ
ncbi:MCE family protein [Pontibacter diazotrophicus]|uniref:MCE family protein n=1 Tax=Pontibacter diazotrophicus TaxID=1400979 RepID=A0A3D8L3C6_9BACT|nr:MlaD family protein [Pontibacter diazotrophicus]RDV11823.1 MCE family protein [Pontibacter diazotrophicus]